MFNFFHAKDAMHAAGAVIATFSALICIFQITFLCEEWKEKKIKSRVKRFLIIGGTGILCALFFFCARPFLHEKIQNYIIPAEDVSLESVEQATKMFKVSNTEYKLRQEDEQFQDVTLTALELGAGNTLERAENAKYNTNAMMSDNVFTEHFGTGGENAVALSNVYTATFTMELPMYFVGNGKCSLSLTRYTCFGETEFTDEELEEMKKAVADVFTVINRAEDGRDAIDALAGKYGCHVVRYQQENNLITKKYSNKKSLYIDELTLSHLGAETLFLLGSLSEQEG